MVQELLNSEVTKVKEVYETLDYDKFTKLEGNREENPANIQRIKKSMSKNYLMSPIVVNAQFKIIDGQHRFEAAVALGLPIRYYIVEPYGLNEVQILNAHGKNWKLIDYLESYCTDLEKIDYQIFKAFMGLYPMFKFKSIEQLLTLGLDKGERTARFKNGLFEVTDVEKSHKYAKQIIEYSEFFPKYSSPLFVTTMIKLFKLPQFSHSELLIKLRLQPTRLVDCNNEKQFRMLLEEIYNYKRKEGNKINLRF